MITSAVTCLYLIGTVLPLAISKYNKFLFRWYKFIRLQKSPRILAKQLDCSGKLDHDCMLLLVNSRSVLGQKWNHQRRSDKKSSDFSDCLCMKGSFWNSFWYYLVGNTAGQRLQDADSRVWRTRKNRARLITRRKIRKSKKSFGNAFCHFFPPAIDATRYCTLLLYRKLNLSGAAYSRLENMDRPESRISMAYRNMEGGTFDRSESRLSRRSLGPPRPPPPRSPRPESPRVETTDLSRLGSLGNNCGYTVCFTIQYTVALSNLWPRATLDSPDKVSKKRLYKRSNTSRIEMISDREMVRQTSKRASMIEEETRKVLLFSSVYLAQFVDKSRRS